MAASDNLHPLQFEVKSTSTTYDMTRKSMRPPPNADRWSNEQLEADIAKRKRNSSDPRDQ